MVAVTKHQQVIRAGGCIFFFYRLEEDCVLFITIVFNYCYVVTASLVI